MSCYEYLLEESRFFRNNQLLESILKKGGLGVVTGDLLVLTTNFDSSPDRVFFVKSLAPAIKLTGFQEDEGTQQITSSFVELIIMGSKGLYGEASIPSNH